MKDASGLTSVAEALAIIGRSVSPLSVVRLPLDQALGLTLAEAIRADGDYPPFDRAMMDGFAVRSEDFAALPVDLEIVGEIAAGQQPSVRLLAGQALRINTGAPVPDGTDAVVPIERVELLDGGGLSRAGSRVRMEARPRPGEHIAPRGTALRAGDVVLEPGVRLGAAQMGAAAAVGASEVAVYRRPHVAILITGDELVPITARPGPGRIRNSNGPCLRGLATETGCEVLDLGVVGDDRAALGRAITQGLQADVLCVTGGVSMGQHDYVPEALEQAGVRIELRKVSIKPGKPMLFGLGPQRQVVFGLPGNPVSCLVGFLVFVRAALDALQGRKFDWPCMMEAMLETPLKMAGPRDEFIPAMLRRSARASWHVAPVNWTGSGDPFGPARADAFVVREALAPALEAGSIVQVMPFD